MTTFYLSREEKKYLLKLARDAIRNAFAKKRQLQIPPKEYKNLFQKRGAFVTLYKEERTLRGCIGIIEPIYPLYEVVQEVAVSSAFKDPRFPPLTPEEFNQVWIEISVLSPLKKGSVEEVKVGVHGVYIKKGIHSGLLLPQVPIEYGWDKETFLRHVCLKAGLHPECYKESDCELYLFTAEIFSEKDFD